MRLPSLITAPVAIRKKVWATLDLPSADTTMVWFLLFLAFAPTRAIQYPGQGLDVDNALQPAPAGGPNVCRSKYRHYCCPGWTIKASTGLCVVPICSRPCASGRCIKPNICLCDGGTVSSSCPSPSSQQQRPDGRDGGTCPTACLNGGSCSGSKCVCRPGYQGEFCGEPVCQEPCLNGGRCIGPDRCACIYGFTGRRCEADYRTGPCFTRVKNEMCQGQLQGVVCTKQLCCATVGQAWGHPCEKCPTYLDCDEGYLKNIHSGQCVDVDECEAIPGLCQGGKCVNTVGSFNCECPEGQTRNIETNECEDRDECKEAGFCQDGRCVNTDGSYYCVCNQGFIPSQDRKGCIDARQGNCYTSVTQTGQCRNRLPIKLSKKDCCCGMNMGKGWSDNCDICPTPNTEAYKRLCHPSPGDITQVNECALRANICGNGRCIDTPDGYRCDCYPGYFALADIDECSELNCCQGGQCTNTPGSFNCVCPPGFDVSSDGKYCIDHDECSQTGMCANGQCINMDGSFKCHCHSGFILSPSGHACVDIDECISNPRQHGSRINSQGSFRCECTTGFILGPDGRSCLDTRRDLRYSQFRDGQRFNPTAMPVTKSSCCCCTVITGQPMGRGTPCQPCPPQGSFEFQALCPHGAGMTFNGDDINECAQTPDICQNGACENLMGTYRCICNPGYQVDNTGKICSDINECELDDLVCSGGQCRNTPGSFQCICPMGTQLNPVTQVCEDINECRELGPDACFNGACVNSVGSYECECEPGFILDNTGRICIDNRKGSCWTRLVGGRCENNLHRLTLKSECCCSIGLAWGSPCEICHGLCDCPKGYAKVDGKTCTDVNECDLNVGVCRGGGTCVNTDGSFTCTCPPGLTLDPTGTVCLDVRQEACYTEYRHGQCSNPLEGIFSRILCCCSSVGKAWGGGDTGTSRCEPCPRSGTQAHQELCPKGNGFIDRKDIDECTEFPGMCSDGRCKNTVGGFSCKCNQGYGIKCIDIDAWCVWRWNMPKHTRQLYL